MDYQTIEMAFDFVSSAPPFENNAVVSRSTGEAYYASAMQDMDEIPDDVDENDDYVRIPHKNDLDLGRELVYDFVRLRCPEETDHVRSIFARRGAYARFKGLLAERGLLDAWYSYENERTKEALLLWCNEKGLVIEL